MLKRISAIQNIGAFKDCSGRACQFDKITLIYGRNTYGKSTLADIFSSLKTNATERIMARNSIPNDGAAQKIELSFSAEQGKQEVKAVYNTANWSNSLPAHYNLAVYDDGFYHSHVFTGRNLTRDNKTKFSDFVLGEQGVEKARLIAEKNQEKTIKTKRKNQLERDVLNTVGDVQGFIERPVIDDIVATQASLEGTRQDYGALLRLQKQSTAIRKRSNLPSILLNASMLSSIDTINNIFPAKLENQHEMAKVGLQNHIARCFSKPEGAEQWIQQGLGYIKDESCNFCGQALTPEVNKLLDIYRQCFDDQFFRYENNITTVIKRSKPQLNLRWIDGVVNSLDQTALIIQTYPELEQEAQEVFVKIQSSHENIRDLLVLIKTVSVKCIEGVESNIQIKLSQPSNALEKVDTQALSALYSQLEGLIHKSNNIHDEFNNLANTFKGRFENEQVEKDLVDLKNKGVSLALDVKRYEKKDACVEYKELDTTISSLSKEVPKLKEDLAVEQADFLKKYFKNINRYFNSLGSKNFTLGHGIDNRGHKPVNFFNVKFHGKSISESNLDKVFSESDRRSLGLAIFLSALDALDVSELSKTIVVLDDPVTSFDEHRVSSTHKHVVQLSDRCQQIILLSHFKDGIASFFKVHGFSRSDIQLIEIIKNNQSSDLIIGDVDSFIKSSHRLNTDELIDFVERRTDKLNCKPRVYLEEIISLRFTKQIREHSVTNESLSKRIEALKNAGIICNAVADQLDYWRTELNPEHHVWMGNDIDDQRNTVDEFLKFIFYELVPEQLELCNAH